jgi:NosR/NirI family nitrous oxide reductase transcriptional regulator
MRMQRRIAWAFIVVLLLWLPLLSTPQVQERFPKPDFQTDYTRPDLLIPSPRAQALEYLDLIVLFAALTLATYFAHKLRSRRLLFTLMVFCLAYFGFFRKGCVCSVGAVQNIGLALFDSAYAVPLTVILFFLLPLGFALFFGRTFCAAVCPLGAVQDVMVLKPARVPSWLAEVLGILPYLYLGLAVLFAATGAGFIICRYDPFIGFFRFGASFNMILLGASILLLGTVVARPYCRFLCPYGVLLGWMSRISRRHVKITPSECINCRLCEESCPFGAIRKANETVPQEGRDTQVKRLAVLILLLPILTAGGGWIGARVYIPLSRAHVTVSLAEDIMAGKPGHPSDLTDPITAFHSSGKSIAELYAEAGDIQRRFRLGSWFLGGFIGLFLGLKMISLSTRRQQLEYDVDTGNCLSCARCFLYCPYEQERRGLIGPEELEEIETRAAEKVKDESQDNVK